MSLLLSTISHGYSRQSLVNFLSGWPRNKTTQLSVSILELEIYHPDTRGGPYTAVSESTIWQKFVLPTGILITKEFGISSNPYILLIIVRGESSLLLD